MSSAEYIQGVEGLFIQITPRCEIGSSKRNGPRNKENERVQTGMDTTHQINNHKTRHSFSFFDQDLLSLSKYCNK